MKNVIHNQLKKGDLKSALELAMSMFPEIEQDVTLLQTRHARAERERRMGLASRGDIEAEFNRITNALLELLGDLPAKMDSQTRDRVHPGGKKALCIGVNKYQFLPELRNCVNDSRLIFESLTEIGFQSLTSTNTRKEGFLTVVDEFADSVIPDSAVIFFYAGHGAECKGKNYLLLHDTQAQTEADIEHTGVELTEVIRILQRNKPTSLLIILDACRNSPGRGAQLPLILQRGFASPGEVAGVMIAFSTASGKLALDGDGSNSPYSYALAEELKVRGRGVEVVFQNIRRRVVNTTNMLQVPWESSSLLEPLVLFQ